MAAQVAGQRGRNVLVLERSNKIGKKILMSGGGRCNFTNLQVGPENYLSENPNFCISALNRYTQWDFIALVEKYKVAYHERLHGELFCNESARDILNILTAECESGHVNIQVSTDIVSVFFNQDTQKFFLETSKGGFCCESLIIATGGLSIPTLGGSGLGYSLAKQFGHHVFPTRAGLVPMMFSDQMKTVTEKLSGLALDVDIGNNRTSFTEALLFTHRGISGPAVLQISNYWYPGEPLWVDLYPSENMLAWLKQRKKQSSKSLMRTVLAERLAKALVHELQSLLWSEMAETAIAEWSDERLEQLAEHFHRWQLKPSGTEGYRTAEVTLGGVDTAEISSKTMESRLQPGLYFVGEVVDVTGWLGGFNFQWAWASGHAAGEVA